MGKTLDHLSRVFVGICGGLKKLVFTNYFSHKKAQTKTRFLSLSVFGLLVGLSSVWLMVNVMPRIFASNDTHTWNFSSAGDYLVSDSNLVEIAAGSAKLKIQEYLSDAQTALLLHFNESSGDPVDSSSFTHSATSSSLLYQSGQLQNSALFNGTTSAVFVNDSAPLSFTGEHTLEAWTKFNETFQAGVSNQRQGIIDKGDYQLYFDNETGKLVYELADSQATTWIQHAGNYLNSSWDISGSPNIESISVIGSNLYVGLGNALGDAQVWKWDGSVWIRVGGDGINNSWGANTYETVQSMTTDGTNLYVGLGLTAGEGEVWRWNGSTWFKVGGDAQYGSWLVNTIEGVYSLYFQNNTLYAGLGLTADDAEVWSCTGCATDTPSWTKIGGDNGNLGINGSWTGADNIEYVYSLTGDGTNIYAGLGLTAGDAEVWRWDGSSWTKVGGDGVGSAASWSTVYEYVYSLFYQNNILYAGLGLTAGEAEVWSCTSCESGTPNWTKIGDSGMGWGATYEGVYSLSGDGTNIYAGLGLTGGEQEIWSWNGSGWTQVGGDGVYSGFTGANHGTVNQMVFANNLLYAGIHSVNAAYSGQVWAFDPNAAPTPTWTWLGGDFKNESWSKRGINSIEVLQVSGDALYAGMGYQYAGNAYVWKMQDDNWSLVGGDGSNNGWAPYVYDKVSSMQSYEGDLYVGLGITANEADLYKLDGSTWSQVGGDGVGWGANFEEVLSQAVLGNYLFVGLGNSSDDAEVWRYDGTNWLKIGGDDGGNGTVYNSWTGAMNIEQVLSLQPYKGKLYAGLGNTNNDAAVWECTGCADPLATPSWTKVGGGGINDSWSTSSLDGFNNVDALLAYRDSLIATLGTGTGEAEVWEYNGSNWIQIGGGANIRGSWDAGSYERVRTIGVYNGHLYAGLGNSTGDGEVWRYNGTTWTNVAGDGVGWGVNVFEEMNAISVYEGKLYMGSGNTASADATVWYIGNNRVLKSSTTTQDVAWHHVAAKYDGTTMSLWRDGVSIGSLTTTVAMRDSSSPIIIGATHAGREFGKPRGGFEGMLDEVRISSISRSELLTTPYSTSPQTVRPASPVFTSGIKEYDAFTSTFNAGTGGSVTFRLSSDGGTTWKYLSGGNWTTSSSLVQSSLATDINGAMTTFPVTEQGLLWQAIVGGNGEEQLSVSEVELGVITDTDAPSNPTTLVSLTESGGALLDTDPAVWHKQATPEFSWSGADDGTGSGVAGYYVYFNASASAEPVQAGNFQVPAVFTPSNLVSGTTYYLRLKTKDNAQNIQPDTWAPLTYKFDNTAPTNPVSITVSPAGYAPTNEFTFSWPEGVDTASNIAGYQYKTGTDSGTLSEWSATSSALLVTIPDAAYKTDDNIFYLRTIDNAGNVSSTNLQATYYFAGQGASVPLNLRATQSSSDEDAYSFTWDPPATHLGDESEINYCYTIVEKPDAVGCKFTGEGVTSLPEAKRGVKPGLNSFYLVAKNPESTGGSINYGAYAEIVFEVNAAVPGIPVNVAVSDISDKAAEEWTLVTRWSAPVTNSESVSSYSVYRSTDDVTYSLIGSNIPGTSHINSDLEQITYYYKIKACNYVGDCGDFSNTVSLLPDGKYTEPPGLSAGPTSSAITTKQATISWSTDRASDSKVQYGTTPGSYFTSEPSSSLQTTDHTINLSNLSPGTTYYYKAKWTDEDGNTGISAEKNFTTEPAPSVKDVSVPTLGLDSAIVKFTSTGASSVKIFYGTTTAFGGVKEIATSTSETTYTATIDELLDGTKYYYKINAFDAEDNEYAGTILDFTTMPRPKISTVRIQQVKNTAKSTVLVTWLTNTATSSIVTYYPSDSPTQAQDEVNVNLANGAHRILIRGLLANTPYSLVVKGRDKAGNEAVSEVQRFTTAIDTRPAQISDLRVESTIQSSGNDNDLATAQLIVSWTTDEPATSQVEFGEGTGVTYTQQSQEDSSLTINHYVVISGLTPSKVYHLRAISKDVVGNDTRSADTVMITARATDDALGLVISNLGQVFSFLR
jgi:hypothetical protein